MSFATKYRLFREAGCLPAGAFLRAIVAKDPESHRVEPLQQPRPAPLEIKTTPASVGPTQAVSGKLIQTGDLAGAIDELAESIKDLVSIRRAARHGWNANGIMSLNPECRVVLKQMFGKRMENDPEQIRRVVGEKCAERDVDGKIAQIKGILTETVKGRKWAELETACKYLLSSPVGDEMGTGMLATLLAESHVERAESGIGRLSVIADAETIENIARTINLHMLDALLMFSNAIAVRAQEKNRNGIKELTTKMLYVLGAQIINPTVKKWAEEHFGGEKMLTAKLMIMNIDKAVDVGMSFSGIKELANRVYTHLAEMKGSKED